MARLAAWFAFAMLFAISPAHAHKLKVFATAIGAHIDGTVYFVGGGPARDASVAVTTESGEPLATTQTDQDGKFAIIATRRVDHLILVEAGDGHSARTTIPAADLPASLPPSESPSAASSGASASSMPPSAATSSPALEETVAQAVARQIRPLREQLNAYEDQTRLRDITGGLGYILGIAGLTLWLRARRGERADR